MLSGRNRAVRRQALCWVNIFLGAIFCWLGTTVSAKPAAPAKPAEAAKKRAVAYQAEIGTALTRHHWVIRQNQAGKLIAVHMIGVPPGPGGAVEVTLVDADPKGEAYLTVVLVPKSVTDTDCHANVVSYLYGKKTASGQYAMNGPYPFANSSVLEAINKALNEARKHLTTAHPEYAAQGS